MGISTRPAVWVAGGLLVSVALLLKPFSVSLLGEVSPEAEGDSDEAPLPNWAAGRQSEAERPATTALSPVSTADHWEETGDADGKIRLTQETRALATQDAQLSSGGRVSARARGVSSNLFGAGKKTSTSLLSSTRARKAKRASAAVVLGLEAKSRATTDAGDLLTKSAAGIGVARQKRTPIITDTRVRGSGAGKQVANGSYWVPARLDLDTLMSKIDSGLVDDMIVIKGPYSALYGPGYNFTDIRLRATPRYMDGYKTTGTSSLEYKTNGEQWYGRQTFEGGDAHYGYRVSYGQRTGSDYKTGGNTSRLPSSYQSGDLEFAFGFDPAADQRFEFHYMRLDQNDVEFPGMVFDMDYLNTNSWEVEYVIENQSAFDILTMEAWYNLTRFQGDTFAAGKRRQIPSLAANLFPFDGSGDVANIDMAIANGTGTGAAITDVWALSTGFSSIAQWGEEDAPQLSLGVDLRVIERELNDVEFLRPTESNNFPVPPSHSANPGLLGEYEVPIDESWTLRTGGRLDWVLTDAQDNVPGVGTTTGNAMTGFTGTPQSISDRLQTDSLDRHFSLVSLFVNLDKQFDQNLTASVGFGVSQRAPNLTELYAAGPFVNLLQSGLTTLTGDPELEKESLRQIDVSLDADYGAVRGNLSGFHAWIDNYITFDGVPLPENQIGQKNNRVIFVNTDRATLTGFEASTEIDLNDQLTAFTLMSYTEGRDHSRRTPSRIRGTGDRSDSATNKEPLPSIPPFEARFGIRYHSLPEVLPWAIELSGRMVDNQDRFASSLNERATPGFTTWDLRAFWQARENIAITIGVENFTDKYYREHLDYRAGNGVFQPGINAYFGTEVTY